MSKSNSNLYRGPLPKKQESYEEYEKRKNLSLWQAQILALYFGSYQTSCANPKEEPIAKEDMQKAAKKLESRAFFHPDWIFGLYSSVGLGFFHLGALVEIDFSKEEISFLESRIQQSGSLEDLFTFSQYKQYQAAFSKVAFVQLRRRWHAKQMLWGYKKESLLIHEMIHGLRKDFEENRFEEFAACSLENGFFKRHLSPLFSSASSAKHMLGSLLFINMSLWMIIAWGEGWIELPFQLDPFVFLGSLLLIGFLPLFLLVQRYVYSSWLWHRFKSKLRCFLSNPKAASALALALEGEDLINLSHSRVESWAAYFISLKPGPYRDLVLSLVAERRSFQPLAK